jgi:hypothetical protein
MSRAADSAGIPFEGREFRDHPFAGDDGSCPEGLGRALTDIVGSLASGSDDALASSAIGLVEALRRDRVLVPLIAEAGDLGTTPEGRTVEKTQELSIVSVAGPSGEPVGVMFSSVDAMTTWRSDARPIPVDAARVAAWALTENIAQVVLDPGGASVVCRRGMLWSLVSDEPYVAPWQAKDIARVIEAKSLWGQFAHVVSVSVHSGWRKDGGAGPDLIARVALERGLDRGAIDHITASLADHWAQHPDQLSLVDGIRVELVAAD